MADYYQRQENHDKALEYAEKTLEISGSDFHGEKVERLKAN